MVTIQNLNMFERVLCKQKLQIYKRGKFEYQPLRFGNWKNRGRSKTSEKNCVTEIKIYY